MPHWASPESPYSGMAPDGLTWSRNRWNICRTAGSAARSGSRYSHFRRPRLRRGARENWDSPLVQGIVEQPEERQRNAVIAGGVLRCVLLAMPLVPDLLGRLSPAGGFGQVGQELGRQGEPGRPGQQLVEYAGLQGKAGLAGELSKPLPGSWCPIARRRSGCDRRP